MRLVASLNHQSLNCGYFYRGFWWINICLQSNSYIVFMLSLKAWLSLSLSLCSSHVSLGKGIALYAAILGSSAELSNRLTKIEAIFAIWTSCLSRFIKGVSGFPQARSCVHEETCNNLSDNIYLSLDNLFFLFYYYCSVLNFSFWSIKIFV